MRKLSFTTMAVPGLGAVEAVKAARRFGYTGVDLRVSDYLGELSLNSSAKEITEVRAAFLSEDIQISGLLCYNEQGGKQEESWAKMRESLLRHIDVAIKLGSPSIRIFGGNPDVFKVREDYIQKTAEVMVELIQKAGSEIGILFQNHSSSFTASEIIKLVNMVGSPGLGLIYSPDHSVIDGEDIESLIPELKKATQQLYVSDVIQVGNDYRSVLPGKGIVPIADIYKTIGGKSFEGWTTFKWEKIWNNKLEEPEVALPHFIKFFNQI